MKSLNRRTFLKAALASAISAPLTSMLPRLANAAPPDDYKALVCVLLEGGADSFNMLVPTGTSAHARYRQLRGDMSLARNQLLALEGWRQGLHPRMERMHGLFEDGDLAIVANVGTLVQPVSRAEVLANQNLPLHLFSHNSQRDLWMTANARNPQRGGWAGHLAERLNGGPFFNISVSGRNLMQRGIGRDTLTLDGDIAPFDDFYRVRDGDTDPGRPYRRMIQAARHHANRLVSQFANARQDELDLRENAGGMLDGIGNAVEFSTGAHETGKPLGEQLALVSRLIQASQIPGNVPGDPRRQIFFVNYHGWDTHNTPLHSNSHLVDYLDESLGAFQREMRILGLENQVTTFTISDFGRSLTPNGAGTDHGWGGHAWVMGGAVSGGIHGDLPAIQVNSPDAVDDRLIPTTSVEQYLATLSTWLGADPSDIRAAFLNIDSFATADLGFMV